jgi:ABC-type transporter Mla MlaB component
MSSPAHIRPIDVDVSPRLVLMPGTSRDDIPRLCAQLRELVVRTSATMISCDVGAVTRPGLTCLDAVARLQLTAKRLGCQLWLEGVNDSWTGLLALTGLNSVIRHRQAEHREEPLHVEKVVHPGDAPG